MTLDHQTKQEIKEYLEQARQSGKMETSGLVQEILKQMDRRIGESVKTHVNGTIAEIHTKLEEYIVEDNKWKERAEPWVKMAEDTSKGGRFIKRIIIGLLKFIVLLGAAVGAWMAIKEFIKR